MAQGIEFNRAILYREGRLQEFKGHLEASFRADPSNPQVALELFELAAVMGDWERCHRQLDLLADLDKDESWMLREVYAPCVAAERLRVEIFAGRMTPLVFGEPGEWVAPLVDSLRVAASGSPERGRDLLLQGLKAAPEIPGTVNGEPFHWIRDADARVGPLLEAVIGNKYYWVPLEHIRSIQIQEPTQIRDLVWVPSHFIWANEGSASGMIPVRYPGSTSSDDPNILLASRTEWPDAETGFQQGLGQRLFMTERETEIPCLEVRTITLETDSQDETAAPETG